MRCQEVACKAGQTVVFTKEHGKQAVWTAKVNLLFQTAGVTKGNTKITKNMATASLNGQMVRNMRVTGKMGDSMDSES
jgi:hypothetical protein